MVIFSLGGDTYRNRAERSMASARNITEDMILEFNNQVEAMTPWERREQINWLRSRRRDLLDTLRQYHLDLEAAAELPLMEPFAARANGLPVDPELPPPLRVRLFDLEDRQ